MTSLGHTLLHNYTKETWRLYIKSCALKSPYNTGPTIQGQHKWEVKLAFPIGHWPCQTCPLKKDVKTSMKELKCVEAEFLFQPFRARRKGIMHFKGNYAQKNGRENTNWQWLGSILYDCPHKHSPKKWKSQMVATGLKSFLTNTLFKMFDGML